MRFCKICGRSDDEIPFYRHTNECRECALLRISAYNKKRTQDPEYKEKQRERWKKWRKANPRKRNSEMEKKSKQSSPRRFMSDMMAHLRRQSRKSGTPFDVELDYVENLWKKQRGRCSLTGVEMTHTSSDLFGVRIDAIDRSKGYIKGNVQLICDGIKRMKKDMSNDAVKSFIREIKSIAIA